MENDESIYLGDDPYLVTAAEDKDEIFKAAWDVGVQVPAEMFDFIKVMTHSARVGKYPPNNWLQKTGAVNSDRRSMHSSMFRHTAESSCNNRVDPETGMDPLLHLACRALMLYCRIKRGLA